jgi:hypothetical protein
MVSSTLGAIFFPSAIKKAAQSNNRFESLEISSVLPNIGVNIGYNF